MNLCNKGLLRFLFLFSLMLVICLLFYGNGAGLQFEEKGATRELALANPVSRLLFPGRVDSSGLFFAQKSNSEIPGEISPQSPASPTLLTELDKEEIAAGKYFRLIDETGKMITATGRRLRPGDQYLDEKNRLYTVEDVEGYTARACYVRTEKLKKPIPRKSRTRIPENEKTSSSNIPAFNKNFTQNQIGGRAVRKAEEKDPGWPRRIIALYHTHNDECYVPSDGVESVYGKGGIHAVGEAFKEALEEKGIEVVYSEDLHLPHDRDAYLRARGTAVELLEHDPDAIFDLHRDAAPPETYMAEIDTCKITKIQFVVGQENPSFTVNRNFAYDLKALADDLYPGLIKGVFIGWGDFNQDLTPLNLLLEVGTHLNSKEEAQSGISLFADVVSYYFYGDPAAAEDTGKEAAAKTSAWGGRVWRVVLAIGALAIAALLGFYFLNNPGVWRHLQQKFTLYLGSRGLVWREGRRNLIRLGRDTARGARQILVYIFIAGGFFIAVFRRLGKKLRP